MGAPSEAQAIQLVEIQYVDFLVVQPICIRAQERFFRRLTIKVGFLGYICYEWDPCHNSYRELGDELELDAASFRLRRITLISGVFG